MSPLIFLCPPLSEVVLSRFKVFLVFSMALEFVPAILTSGLGGVEVVSNLQSLISSSESTSYRPDPVFVTATLGWASLDCLDEDGFEGFSSFSSFFIFFAEIFTASR